MSNYSMPRLRLIILLLSLMVLLVTLGFNALLSVSALDNFAKDAILAGYKGNGLHLVRTIERGMRFGKPLDHYAGMDALLHEFRDSAAGIIAVQVSGMSGEIFYVSSDRAYAAQKAQAAQKTQNLLSGYVMKDSKSYQELPGAYRVVLPLRIADQVGWLTIDVSKQAVDAGIYRFAEWTVILLVACCVLVGLMMFAWIKYLTSTTEDRSLLGKSLVKLLVLQVGGAQLVYLAICLVLFSAFVEDAMQSRADIQAQSLKRDLEYLVHRGVDITTLKGLDAQVGQMLASNEDLAEAVLLQPDNSILVQAGTHHDNAAVVERRIDAYWPTRFQQKQEILRIRLALDASVLWGKVTELGVDLVTSFIISLLLLYELAKLLSLISVKIVCAGREIPAIKPPAFVGDARTFALRAAGFVFFLGYDMGISFIPMLAQKLYAPMWGLSEEIITGLPISFEMLFAGVALLSAGHLSVWMGWQRTFALGAVCAACGLAFAGVADHITTLILARAVAGFGFGIVLMTAQIAALGNHRAGADIASLFAGIFSGSICGSAAGAMLADRFGYHAVFLTAAVIVPLCVFVLPLGQTRQDSQSSNEHAELSQVSGGNKYWMFVKNPKVLTLLFFVGFPVALCLTGFLHYQLPLLLSAAHVDQPDIGRVFMLYGLCFVTVGGVLGAWIDRSATAVNFAALAALLSGAALLVAGTIPGLSGAVIAVICIGIAQCIAAPATMLCAVRLRAAAYLGKDKTASTYRTLERIGQVLGPILFGSVVVALGVSQGLLLLGGIVCGLAVLFWVAEQLKKVPE